MIKRKRMKRFEKNPEDKESRKALFFFCRLNQLFKKVHKKRNGVPDYYR